MTKLGFLFTFALFAQGVMADKAGTQYSNMATAITETGASISWAADLNSLKAPEIDAQQLKQMHEQTKLQINEQLQQHISKMIEDSLEVTGI